MNEKVTREVLESHLLCRVKGYLKHRGEQGTKSEYEQLVDESKQALRRVAEDMILARYRATDVTRGTSVSRPLLMHGPSLILDATLENDLVSIRVDGLKRVSGPSDLGDFHYVPILFGEGGKARQLQRRTLEICGLVLGEVQGRCPDKGILVDPEQSSFAGVRFEAGLRTARALLEGLLEIRDAGSPPELMLNNHCCVCEFQRRCRAEAAASDNLSLLRGMGEKDITKLRRRGIFTLTQLSCTYRPRRTSDKARRQVRGHSFALQALAIRENKIYVLGKPELPDSPVRIYFDIEGDPDRASAYLLGMIVDEGGSEKQFSFWVDGESQEEQILEGFLNIVGGYRGYRVFCYGSFETAFLKRMRRAGWEERIDPILARTTNILPIIYSSLYFPIYSNGLKEIGGHLGFRWSEADASGLQCIVWRRGWEETRDEGLKRKIEVYNLEDCAALGKLVRFLHWICAGGGTDGPRPEDEPMPSYSGVEECAVQSSRREWCKVNFAIPDFDYINNLSYFDYQRDRVFVRSSERLRKARSRARKSKGRKRVRINERIEIRCHECPSCKSTRLLEWHDGRLSRVVMDLGITASGIRRRFVQVKSPRHRCEECGRTFAPPEYYRVDRHSHSLKSWAMYEHVAHRVSLENLGESLRECFGLRVNADEIHGFKYLMARHYETTFEQLRAKIVTGSVILADETEVNVKGVGKGYVWVFTNLEEVIYLYKPSREGGFLHDFLNGFGGVLVSDFYTAYDSLPCAQQKCLIHLIRDFNNDILANPFNEEVKVLAADFGRLLRAAVTTIDHHGLSRRHLSKHGGDVERFFESVSGRTYRSEVAQAYQKRLEKYRGKLFTFLDHDGVPWNNNNAEHAVKKFAYYREIADGLLAEGGLRDYLTLLSIYQTCVYKGISFLKFLVSQEQDIDRFCDTGQRSREVPAYDLYPEGYIPPRRRHKALQEVHFTEGPASIVSDQ
jgi:predicted RecB family nuclease